MVSSSRGSSHPRMAGMLHVQCDMCWAFGFCRSTSHKVSSAVRSLHLLEVPRLVEPDHQLCQRCCFFIVSGAPKACLLRLPQDQRPQGTRLPERKLREVIIGPCPALKSRSALVSRSLPKQNSARQSVLPDDEPGKASRAFQGPALSGSGGASARKNLYKCPGRRLH